MNIYSLAKLHYANNFRTRRMLANGFELSIVSHGAHARGLFEVAIMDGADNIVPFSYKEQEENLVITNLDFAEVVQIMEEVSKWGTGKPLNPKLVSPNLKNLP